MAEIKQNRTGTKQKNAEIYVEFPRFHYFIIYHSVSTWTKLEASFESLKYHYVYNILSPVRIW